MTGSAVPLARADTVTVTVASSVTVTVSCVQALEKGRVAPASPRDADPDSTTVWVKGPLVTTTVE